MLDLINRAIGCLINMTETETAQYFESQAIASRQTSFLAIKAALCILESPDPPVGYREVK